MVMGNFQALPDGDRSARPTAQVTEVTAEEVSLLVDGELDADRVDRVCHGLRELPAVETWVCYHVIGDALRGQCALRPGFAARFSAQLAAEPTVLAPPRPGPAPAEGALAIAAAVAGVGVEVWFALATMLAPVAEVATA